MSGQFFAYLSLQARQPLPPLPGKGGIIPIDQSGYEELAKEIIEKNIHRIQTETSLGGPTHSSVVLQDDNGAEKIIEEINFTAYIQKLQNDNRALSPMELALVLQSQTSDKVDISDILSDGILTGNQDVSYINPRTGKRFEGNTQEINELGFSCHFSSNWLSSITARAAESPFSPFYEQFSNSLIESRRISTSATYFSSPGVLKESEYELNVIPIQGIPKFGENPIGIDSSQPAHLIQYQRDSETFQLIGLMIDKFEVHDNGTETRKEPFIIVNPSASKIIDKKIRYGATYRYAISSIGILRTFEYSAELKTYVQVDSLVRSRGGQGKTIKCVETTPPMPPQDIHMIYNYEFKNLTILWNPPVNSQKDIVRYQIFRREKLEDQFDLIGQIDFDQSVKKQKRSETVPESINQLHQVPKYKFVDTSYDRGKTYIYALCSVDAHDLSSNYSMQFTVKFGLFDNKLYVSKFSGGNAPKPFPNLNLTNTISDDSIKISQYNNLKIYFNPSSFFLEDSKKNDLPYLDRSNDNGEYKLQLINIDRQISRTISIEVEDLTPAGKGNTSPFFAMRIGDLK